MTTAARPGADPIQLAEAQRRLEEKRRALGAPDAAPPRFPKVRGPHKPTPRSDAKAEAHEASEADTDALPHIKPGDYDVVYRSAERAKFWGRERWVIRFGVVEPGAAHGVVIPMFVNVPPAGAKPRRGWALSALYVTAVGRPPPASLATIHPRAFLANAVFVGRVVDVTRNQHGAAVAEAARYSKLAFLKGRAVGKAGPS